MRNTRAEANAVSCHRFTHMYSISISKPERKCLRNIICGKWRAREKRGKGRKNGMQSAWQDENGVECEGLSATNKIE